MSKLRELRILVLMGMATLVWFFVGYEEGKHSVHPKSETTTTVPAGRICITIAGSQLPPGVYCRTS